MPTLDWIGKDAVIRSPFRLLEPHAELSHGDPAGNLIQGNHQPKGGIILTTPYAIEV